MGFGDQTSAAIDFLIGRAGILVDVEGASESPCPGAAHLHRRVFSPAKDCQAIKKNAVGVALGSASQRLGLIEVPRRFHGHRV